MPEIKIVQFMSYKLKYSQKLIAILCSTMCIHFYSQLKEMY